MNLNTIDESNQHEVDLAFKTLEFLGQLDEKEIPAEVLPKMRDVIANISDFQFRFAAPMDLPMGFGRPQDMSRFLPTPKPVGVLTKYKFAYTVDDNRNTMRQDDGVIVDGNIYCFAGKDTWKSLVDSGKLTGDDAKSPNLKSADWMKDLFAIFQHASTGHKHLARRLAACTTICANDILRSWYHIATQIDYEASPEDEEEEAETAATMQEAGLSFLSLMAGPQGMMMTEEDEEEDEDFNPDGEDEEDNEAESDEEDAEIDDGEEGDDVVDGAEKEKEEKSNREEKEEKEEKSNDEEGDDAEDDEEDGEFDEDVEFSEREISPEEQAYRKAILDAVESLNAYLPSPGEDMAWFKRALKAMSMAPMMGLTEWYPFGIPPLEPLKRCAESADEQEKQYANTILKIYERLGA